MKFGLERYITIKDLTRGLSGILNNISNRLTAVETPSPISAITGLGDVLKVGLNTTNNDAAYTVSFNTPFISGEDSDISVVINRQVSDTGAAMTAINITKTGFQIDRVNTINGNQTINYIAINGSYL